MPNFTVALVPLRGPKSSRASVHWTAWPLPYFYPH